MPFKKHGRRYDIIALGATGYTGQLIAEYIATHLPTDLKWAVAGRSEAKLQTVVDGCNKLNSDRVVPGIELVNVNDEQQVTALAKKAFVILTSVGPFCKYGELVFKACAENGTHYFDATGEFPWVHLMIKKYEGAARASGAMMFPQIGIESAPPDLCTWAMAKHLRETMDAQTGDVAVSIHKLRGAPSGGTLATVMAVFDVFTLSEVQAATAPFAQSPIPHRKPARPPRSLSAKIFGVCSIPNLGLLTTSVAGGTDIPVVERSWGLLSQIPSRKEQFYGPNFRWREYFRARNWFHGIAIHWGLLIGSALLAILPPLRRLMKRLVAQPGQGPSKEARDAEEVEYRGVAWPDTETTPNQQAFCRAWFNGSMYYLTGLFLSQGAMTLLEEDVGLDGGIYTPACLGQAFVDRCHDAGFNVEVKLVEV